MTTVIDELIERLRLALPLLDGLETGQDCADYAFAKAEGFQAMTYCPEAFEALRSLPEAITQLAALKARCEALVNALDILQMREAAYRSAHDLHGDGSAKAGFAWDAMRRSGDNARTILAGSAPV